MLTLENLAEKTLLALGVRPTAPTPLATGLNHERPKKTSLLLLGR